MKALAARPRDTEDIRQLAAVLELRTTTWPARMIAKTSFNP